MTIEPGSIILSEAMQARIATGELREEEVRDKTAEAFQLLRYPILMHYDGKDTQQMKLLLESGLVDVDALADIPLSTKWNAEDALQAGLLHLANLKNKPDIIALLCVHGANPNLLNSEGYPPLHNICFDDLERSYPDHNRIRYFDQDALKSLASTLIAHGANPNLCSRDGINASIEAMAKSAYFLCQLYLDLGADFSLVPQAPKGPKPKIKFTTYEHLKHQWINDDERDMQMSPVAEPEHSAATCIRFYLASEKAINSRLANQDRSPPNRTTALQAANIGKLHKLLAPGQWKGQEAQIVKLIVSLPPFVQEQLSIELNYYLQLSQRNAGEKPAQDDSWCARISAPTPPASKTK